MKNIFLLIFVLIIFVEPAAPRPITVLPVVIDGVFMGNALPEHGTLYADTPVRGAAFGNAVVLYTAKKGTPVSLREVFVSYETWVMISPIEWVRLSDICEGG
jgi:hypothetical protein